jgi:diaminopimelate decarboxylase
MRTLPCSSHPAVRAFTPGRYPGPSAWTAWPDAAAAKYGRDRALQLGLVFDSPVKSQREIDFALEAGIPLNVDNWEELGRVDDWVRVHGAPAAPPPGSTAAAHPLFGAVGIRLNPQGNAGSLTDFSTGTATSKFGIGLEDSRRGLVLAYQARPWLNMAHVHVGSQGARSVALSLCRTHAHSLARTRTRDVPPRTARLGCREHSLRACCMMQCPRGEDIPLCRCG